MTEREKQSRKLNWPQIIAGTVFVVMTIGLGVFATLGISVASCWSSCTRDERTVSIAAAFSAIPIFVAFAVVGWIFLRRGFKPFGIYVATLLVVLVATVAIVS